MLVSCRGKNRRQSIFSPLICLHLSDFFQLIIILQEES